MEQKQTEGSIHRGVSQNAAESVTAVVIFLIGVVIMFDSYRIGWGWAVEGPQAGYFPFRIGVITCIASIAIFLRSFSGKKATPKFSLPGNSSNLCWWCWCLRWSMCW